MIDAPIDLLKAMAHPARFAILQCLAAGERNVGDIEQASGIGQPALSQQLAVLRDSGLVNTRREAKMVFYRINASAITKLQEGLGPILDSPPNLARGLHQTSEAVAVFAKLA